MQLVEDPNIQCGEHALVLFRITDSHFPSVNHDALDRSAIIILNICMGISNFRLLMISNLQFSSQVTSRLRPP